MSENDFHENKKIIPPQWAVRFLTWFCPSGLQESIEGDLIEQFEADLMPPEPSDRSKRSDGYLVRRARQKFVWNTINFFRPGIILRNNLTFTLINTIMI